MKIKRLIGCEKSIVKNALVSVMFEAETKGKYKITFANIITNININPIIAFLFSFFILIRKFLNS